MQRILVGLLVLVMLIVPACGGSGDDDDAAATESGAAVTSTESSDSSGSTETATEAESTATETEESTSEASETETESATSSSTATEVESEATSGDGTADDETAASGPITIEHTLGSTELDAPAKRVVVLEWDYAEALLTLGVQPVGVADIEGFNKWLQVEPALAEDVVDVGTRQEPSLESILSLEPDLIIGIKFRHEPIYQQLSDIAPTIILEAYPTEESVTQYDRMIENFNTIAKATGHEDGAEQVLTDLNSYYDDAAATLEEAGQAGTEFTLAQAFTSQDTPQIRLFLDNSMAVQVLERIGLSNAWEGEPDSFGFNTVGIEALTEVGDASFFYVVQEDDNVFANQWAENPVWTSLPFVQEGRTYSLGGGTWLFGGPQSAKHLVDKVVAALTG